MANTFNFGNPNYFVKGIVDVILRDRTTGNIIGYDNVASESALNYTFNLQEITGGFNNQLVGVIPDTTRLTGTYTSQAFSLAQRAMLSGGVLEYNGVAPVCESIVADGSILTVTKVPTRAYSQSVSDEYAWCYVKQQGVKNYPGVNYSIDMTTRQVQDFTAQTGVTYEVTYFTASASNQVLGLPGAANPSVVSVTLKYGVYAKQNNSAAHGTLQGYLYVEVPYAMLNGDAGVSASQTANSTTDYNWMALSSDEAGGICTNCATPSGVLAYYIYAPCASSTASVSSLAVIGAGVTVGEGESAQIPVVFVMPNGQTLTPDYAELEYTSQADATATVSATGVVTGEAAGNTSVTITLDKADGTTLTAICYVQVTE